MNERHLGSLGFDLAYLALLTRYDIKRLSRWEQKLPARKLDTLRELGLEVQEIERRIFLGRKTHEVVFSARKRWTALYASRFNGTRIKNSGSEIRLKGFLFGYPACCVERFISRPYSKNDLAPHDQRILFHWACPGCKVTPPLIKDYRAVHNECLRIFGEQEAVSAYYARPKRGYLLPDLTRILERAALPATLCVSAMLALPQLGRAKSPIPHPTEDSGPDPHLLAVDDDIDMDYVSYGEEMLRGLDPENPDVDGTGVVDGIEEAHYLRDLIYALPWYYMDDPDVPTDSIYAIEFLTLGLEECTVCGEIMNMGFLRIMNPMRDVFVDVPYMCLHYMDHGGLSYDGTVNSGRLDLALLKRVVSLADSAHYIALGSDPDGDGLIGEEEKFLGTAPMQSDSDGDSVKDGPQFLEPLIEALSNLPQEECQNEPYLIEHRARGVETCAICGGTFNMGYAHIANPIEGLSLDVPFIALHYFGHGWTTYWGSVNVGRVLPVLLRTVLTGDGTSHWLGVDGDTDGDGLKDEEEAHFSLDPAVTDTDGDGIPDGPELAVAMASVIDELPEGPLPDSTYVIHNLMYGIYKCLICDEAINMGYMEIVNPQRGTSIAVPYYNLHFMRHGSFSSDRIDLYPRLDPRAIDDVLDLDSYAFVAGSESGSPAFLVYPNPFRSEATVLCNLPEATEYVLAIYDVSGRLVRDLTGSASGKIRVTWDGRDAEDRRVPSGVYFCRLKTGEIDLARKIVLLP
jgi:hypothetical protein